MSVHSVSLKGKRPQNEDKHNIIINIEGEDKNNADINYYAVYDGHGGKFVSKFLYNNLYKCFTDKRVTYPLKKEFVKKIYEYYQNLLKSNYKEHATNAGSTCLVVVQYRKDECDFLNILNTGDSRCVLCRNNIGIPLTKDNKPHWPEESARIRKLGGQIVNDGYDWRICDLSVSRAFGDISAEPYLTCIPDYYKYKLNANDKFMIIACDGLWDVMNNQDAVNFVLDNCYDQVSGEMVNSHVNISKKLAEHAINNIGSTDNVTAIVVFFQ
jgi:serine/threonine protein phosphatase PrpC